MPQRHFVISGVVTFFLAIFFWLPVTADEGRESLLADYQQLQERLANNPFHAPIAINSVERNARLSAEVFSLLDYPFADVAATLSTPPAWCELLPLNLNIKACVYRREPPHCHITLYAGRKFYQPPEDGYPLDYRFTMEAWSEDYLRVHLEAPEGPVGTEDYHLVLEAVALDDKTFVRIASEYKTSMASRMATSGYLATLGRNKIGFTAIGTHADGSTAYVKGVRGIIERNVVRYYLAMESFLYARSLPPTERFEARITHWYDATERYHDQLYELGRDEYLSAKRREQENQQMLQQDTLHMCQAEEKT